MAGRMNRSNGKTTGRRHAWNITSENLSYTQNVQGITYGLRSIPVNKKMRWHPPLTVKSERFLHLPAYKIQNWWEENVLHFGPSVAIYAVSGKRSLFGPQTGLFREMALIAKSRGIDLFIVTPGHFQYDRRQSLGYRYNSKQKRWRLELCPWPDFVWRRVVTRPLRCQRQMDLDENLLTQTSLVGTLPRIQSEKWFIHTILSQSSVVLPFLLPAVLVQTPYDLLRAVQQLGDVYLKPVRGTQGQRIVRVLTTASGYVAQWAKGRSDQPPPSEVLATDRDVLRRFAGIRASTPFIAQRTVSLLRTISNEPFDLRYLIQAPTDENSPPLCTGIVARVASNQAVTTNLHTGALPLSVQELEDRMAPHTITLFQQAVDRGEKAAIAAFIALSNQHKALAELGVDIALDRQGRAFVLEVNPCPGRQMFRRVDPVMRRLSLERVLEYAVFRTDFLRSVKGADLG